MLDIKRRDQNPKDENGRYHGECLGYHDNGILWYSHNWVHGFRNGLHSGYSNDGRLVYCGNYNMGKQVGFWYTFHNNKYYLWLI